MHIPMSTQKHSKKRLFSSAQPGASCKLRRSGLQLARQFAFRGFTSVPPWFRNYMALNNFHLLARLGTVVALTCLVNWLRHARVFVLADPIMTLVTSHAALRNAGRADRRSENVPLLVQKYGGTSIADPEKILRAARRAIAAHRQGSQVVVVVSAGGDTTDDLLAMARQISDRPPARELDMLLATGEQVSVALMAIAIESLGVPAISFTAAQIGILTDSLHTRARIREISTERVFQALGEGKIVIVAGFQGVDHNAEITTLGRGGSDTTAVALAAVLGADACEVYTDVNGVSTADPRIVPEARKIDRISYDEMMELASLGAGVMQSRSIEFAKKYDVPIVVRGAFSDDPGTWIVADGDARRLGWSVTGAALVRDEARITVHGVPDCPESLHTLFRRVAEANVAVDMILKNIMREGAAKVSFTVAADEQAAAIQAANAAAQEIGAAGVVSDSEVSKVSVVGLGMKTHFGVAATMLEALARAEVGVQMITTSEIKISVLVERSLATWALRAVHRAFGLDAPVDGDPAPFVPGFRRRQPQLRSLIDDGWCPTITPANPTATAGGLEDLVITGIELDDRQGRVTVLNIPDRPGFAAQILRRVAEETIFVDMIVQNISLVGTPNLSITVPRRDVERAAAVIAEVVGPHRVATEPAIAKLSVVGVGMRSHTGVAAAMFRALAERDIAVSMVNTSEVSVNVVTGLQQGRAGLESLQDEFLQPDRPQASVRSAVHSTRPRLWAVPFAS
jgi:aspartate kinase